MDLYHQQRPQILQNIILMMVQMKRMRHVPNHIHH
jgi:hypothetical protein